MKVSHVALAILLGISVALTGNLIVAPYSARGYRELEAHRDRLEANIAELQGIHETLAGQVELLTRSTDAVRVEARNLGYYDPGETVIRIENAPSAGAPKSPGRIILELPPQKDRRAVVRVVALLVALSAFVVLAVNSRHSSIRPSR